MGRAGTLGGRDARMARARGLPELREAAAAERCARAENWTTPGVSSWAPAPSRRHAALIRGLGDEARAPRPGLPDLRVRRSAGRAPRRCRCLLHEASDFAFATTSTSSPPGRAVHEARQTSRQSPHNPTGGVVGAETLGAAAAADLCMPAWVLSDEVYSATAPRRRRPPPPQRPGGCSRTTPPRTTVDDGMTVGDAAAYAAVPDALGSAPRSSS